MIQIYHFDLCFFWYAWELDLAERSVNFCYLELPCMRGGCEASLVAWPPWKFLMLKHGRYLGPFAVCEFRRAYCVYRSALNCLADRAISLKLVRYHFRPKLHFLGHLVWNYLPANPRYYMNYSDDFIARTKRIAERSHPGHMSRLTLLRYIIHASLRFSGETI